MIYKMKHILIFFSFTFSSLMFQCLVSSCSHGYFSLDDKECHSWLNCKDIKELNLGTLIGFGAVKKIYVSTWKNFAVAVVFANNPEHLRDFEHGLQMLINLNPHKFVALLIGYCKESNVYVMKYYPYGSLLHFEKLLSFDPRSNFKTRFKLCLSYIEIINFIHSNLNTPAVMCDTNTINKTLEQYLLDTDSLVLNDVDALTEVKSSGIICGHREITGNFVAPEQLWPHKGITYDEKLMPLYNEKTDIWKIPSVCQHILGDSKEAIAVRYHLFKVNKQCRNSNPSLRPNASEVLDSYIPVYNDIFYVKEEF